MANIMGQTLEQTSQDIEDMLDYLETREGTVEKFGFEWEDFITKKATEIINEEIVETIKWKMKMWKFSPKIINATYLDKVIVRGRGISAFIKSDYISSNGFPVSVAREYGTKRHWIQPKSTGQTFKLIWNTSAKAGSPLAKARRHGYTSSAKMVPQPQPKPVSLHWKQGGKSFFSKGHYVSGIQSLKLINKTIKEKRRIVKERLKDDTKKWVDDLLS